MIRNLHRLNPQRLRLILALACFLGGPQFVEAGPVFLYEFPTSWNGSGTAITDLSPAGNHATTAGAPVLSPNIPPGAPNATQSINTDNGGLVTNNTSLLTNVLIAAAGGFRFDATIFWNGGPGFGPNQIQKIIDYAGTEFLQLQAVNVAAGTATLRFGFNDNTAVGPNLNTTINANQWYTVSGIFDTLGNAVASNGSLSGQATLIVNGNVFTDMVTKSNFGDSLNRRIGIGNFSNATSAFIQFRGDIYSASVQLVPEPATAMLLGWGMSISSIIALRRRFV
jgi:hypothetical protein